MKFIYIDEPSIDEIINTRHYQSIEFSEARDLTSFLRGEVPHIRLTPLSSGIQSNAGGYILDPASKTTNYVVFDLEEMKNLLALDSPGLLLAFQKTVRFCKKIMNSLSLSKNEKILSDGKAVIFPYPIGLQTSLRLTIERNPDTKRRAKREKAQACLVYKFGDNEGQGTTEVASLTNFRRAVEGKDNAARTLVARHAANDRNDTYTRSMAVTQLDPHQGLQLHEYGLDNWRRWLTESQMRFIEAPLTSPHRIEGPAGTGKTLCLVLKAIHLLESSKAAREPQKAIFVTHSQSTKAAIQNLFTTNGGEHFLETDVSALIADQSVEITTLHELCAKLLQYKISDAELVDRDAYESKLTQKLYSLEAVEKTIKDEIDSHRPYLSSGFTRFLESTEKWAIAEMLQHEISIQIKGRAQQDLSKYKKLPALKFGLPLENEGDKAFVYLMHECYQNQLIEAAQFDTDDVVLSAISQLTTPIWRRRRTREGYDSIFVDETHLFNVNELSTFHKLTRAENTQPIAYSVDRSQALGDRGWTTEAFDHAFDPTQTSQKLASVDVRSIFRCSPEIIDLAFSVTASAATLFTDFHNPLDTAVSAFSAKEERICKKPSYTQYVDDNDMLSNVFIRADSMAKEMSCQKADIAIIAFGDETFEQIVTYAKSHNKPIEVIKSRGDLMTVEKARQGGRYLLSAPEYVGGLEFAGVILVGVDNGRVPPSSHGTGESQEFLNYAAHQRLYVSITRAKYRVEILGVKARGLSTTLASARANNLLDTFDS